MSFKIERLYKQDQTPTDRYICESCQRIYMNLPEDGSCAFCKEWKCERCGCKIFPFYNLCDGCKGKELYSKATVVKDYQGWVFCEELSLHNEGFFESLDALIEYCEEMEFEDLDFQRPFACFGTKVIQPRCPDISDITEQWIDEGYEGMEDHFEGLDQMELALDVFWRANQHLISYRPDFKIAMIIPQSQKQRFVILDTRINKEQSK